MKGFEAFSILYIIALVRVSPVLSTLQTIVETAHGHISAMNAKIELTTPNPINLEAFVEAYFKYVEQQAEIPDEENTQNEWKVFWGDKCPEHLDRIKTNGIAELTKLENKPIEAKLETIKIIGRMMEEQLRGCGGIQDTLFQPFTGHAIYDGITADSEGVQVNACQMSMVQNRIYMIHVYLLYTFKWTAMDYIEKMSDYKDFINSVLEDVELNLKAVLSDYCTYKINEKNLGEHTTHVPDLENSFNRYKERIYNIIDMFLSTLETYYNYADKYKDASLKNSNDLYKWILNQHVVSRSANENLDADFKEYAANLIIGPTVSEPDLDSLEEASKLMGILVNALNLRYKVTPLVSATSALTDPESAADAVKLLRFVQYLWWRALNGETVVFPF